MLSRVVSRHDDVFIIFSAHSKLARAAGPEELEQGFAVCRHLALPQVCVSVDGCCVALDAEVAAQLHIETNLRNHALQIWV